ncbi:MAG: monooxygenase FAD-binding protein [Firmicutes bacterium]|nr:monooxygenase FAD-binding protein [Bacillota bacterium]
MDVLWFRLPRRADELHGIDSTLGHGHLLIMLERMDEWQIGYVIGKGRYQALRTAGIQQLRDEIVAIQPRLRDRVEQLTDWKQVALLAVESSRVPRWHRPGLLLIGDAAHVMSPVGGIGINYAIQDAVAVANLLTDKLRDGTVTEADLAAVQRRREWPTRVAQALQARGARIIVGRALADRPFRIPFFVKWGPVQHLLAAMVGFGIRPERIARI